MVTTELGACEWFIWDLRRSNLIDRGQLDQVVGVFMSQNPRAEPPALAVYLVEKGILSQFQADRLLQGKTQGFVLGPFTLMDSLGAGSMGTVYKAQSKNDQQWYAVKVLPRRSMWNVRIARRKVRAFESCRHPAVVPFVDVGTAGGMHYLAWPFVEGETLDKVVQTQGKLSPGLAAHIALQIAEGLEVCHQQALFHGLLKPSNVMIGPDRQVYILDLGIGCLLAETEGESLVDTMSTANSVASGLDCASPESIMDPTNLTPTGDQYSLGCILYFCLTGQYPFPDGSSAEKMMAHQFKEPMAVRELNPAVPEDLVEIVQKLMQKTPEKRYPGAAQVVEALRELNETSDAGVAAKPIPKIIPKPALKPTVATPAQPARPAAQPVATPPRSTFSPSAHTPKPPGSGTLPTRESIRAPQAVQAPAKKVQAPAKPVQAPANTAKVDPMPEVLGLPESNGVAAEKLSWDEKLGPLGIIAVTMAGCFLLWAVVKYLF